MTMGLGIQPVVLTHAASNVTSPQIDQRSRPATGIFIPALGTACSVEVQGSFDGSAANAKSMIGADGSTKVGLIASSSGAFWIDGDILARFYGVPFLFIVLGANQAADLTLQVAQGR